MKEDDFDFGNVVEEIKEFNLGGKKRGEEKKEVQFFNGEVQQEKENKDEKITNNNELLEFEIGDILVDKKSTVENLLEIEIGEALMFDKKEIKISNEVDFNFLNLDSFVPVKTDEFLINDFKKIEENGQEEKKKIEENIKKSDPFDFL